MEGASRTHPWAGYAAAAGAAVFAAPHLYWAMGGRTGLCFSLALRGSAEEELIRDPWFVAQGLWGVAGLCVVAGLIGLATVRPWGRAVPRPLIVVGAWAACGVMLLRALVYPGFVFSGLRVSGVVGISERADPVWFRWDLVLWSPWFTLGSVLFGLVAWSNRRSSIGAEIVATSRNEAETG